MSQLHRHKEALDQAYESAKLCNLIVSDQATICDFISRRVNFEKLRYQIAKQPTQSSAPQEESGTAMNADRYSTYSEEMAGLIDGRPN
jgi:hypothetical protein